jgi:hypothetical protein
LQCNTILPDDEKQEIRKAMKMKIALIINFLMLPVLLAAQADSSSRINNSAADSIKGVYIPADLVDCFIELDMLLDTELKEKIRKKDSTLDLHMSVGMWIRNNWGLWGGSRLKSYFSSACPGMHPDSMSSTILFYYADWLNGRRERWRNWDLKCKQRGRKTNN